MYISLDCEYRRAQGKGQAGNRLQKTGRKRKYQLEPVASSALGGCCDSFMSDVNKLMEVLDE